MRIKQWFALLTVLCSVLLLAACGSNSGSGGDQTAAPAADNLGSDITTGIAYVGAEACIGCHEDFSWSAEVVAEYLSGAHVIHSTNISQADAAACLDCHDPIGDSRGIEGFIDPAYVPAGGLAAIGCENCHGAGGDHYGVGPVPNFAPDYTVCGNCHNDDMPHLTTAPFSDAIVENYEKSAHFTSIEAAFATSAEIRAKCSLCHSDEGFRQFSPTTIGLGRAELEALLDPVAPLTNVSPVQCRTCHDSHSVGLRIGATTSIEDHDNDPATAAESVTQFSSVFNLCTTCHMMAVDATFDVTTGTFDYALDPTKTTPTFYYHAVQETVTMTHFDNPTTMEIEGYNINAGDTNACLNCHDAHGATSFAQPFAGGIAAELGNEAGFHGDYQSEAFTHTFTNAVCLECHSGTEFVKITNGLPAADLTVGDARVVGCVACHDLQAKNPAGDFELGALRTFLDADGMVRDSFIFPSGKSVAGVEENILCLTCHSGRESKVSVDEEIAASAGPYGFINIHYRAAGATLYGNFAQGAYEFDGKVYSSKLEHVISHDSCAECHNVHDGRINVDQPFFGGPAGCNTCHNEITSMTPLDPANYAGAITEVRTIRTAASLADYDGDMNTIEGIYDEVEGLKALLLTAIENYAATTIGVAIQYDSVSYPYFFKAGAINFGNRYSDFDATLLKAAYNYQVSQKDPGAYAHNPSYIIEILYDSIEAVGGSIVGLSRGDSGHFDASAEAFRHWDEDGSVSLSCTNCHSSEGAAFLLENGTTLTEYTRLDTNGISNGLGCESCHTAPFDALTVRTVNSVTFPSGAILDNSNAAAFVADNSTICMSCHSGRNSKVQVDAAIAAGPNTDGTFGFTNIHYYAAAASLFGSDVQGGYEYDAATSSFTTDPVYRGQNNFFQPAHATLQTCADCHLQQGLNRHDFIPELATCTAICHPGASFETAAGSPAANKTAIDTLKGELQTMLEASGVVFLSGYPYFSNITSAAQLKAAYNWQTADKEPSGYIHNGIYIIQLLHDSISDLGGTPTIPRP